MKGHLERNPRLNRESVNAPKPDWDAVDHRVYCRGREVKHFKAAAPNQEPIADADLLFQAQHYLTYREYGVSPDQDLEADWLAFYDRYSRRIGKYAFHCGAAEEDIQDCVQDVWTELLKRLPSFRLDRQRGRFDSWLYTIVRSKTVNRRRSLKCHALQTNLTTLQTAIDPQQSPARSLEEAEWFGVILGQLRSKLSECDFQVLQLRLMEDRPVAEVAAKLGLSHEQVWYHYHRARREAEAVGLACAHGQRVPPTHDHAPHEKTGKDEKSAQGATVLSVSRNAVLHSPARPGGRCVDFVFKRIELGRSGSNPEWKVEWNLAATPTPVLYIRKLSVVAYAELCGPEEVLNNHWPRIANAAVTAGVAAGIATIIATPTAALPVFRSEFKKQLQGKIDDEIHVALSASQEANGPWCECEA